ncbi:MAG: SDR family NAD(P)-dependent oxidoreductase [Deltaproteobacteria bacterium]|nr:SDR family NAD(P)-dependent oxidoreductase [Deltaproteobacteria bacterium]
MEDHAHRAVAIVGVGAVLPDAPNAKQFWDNVKTGRYSIVETPPERWDPALYWDPDPKAPDKTYSKIGGWIRDFEWDPLRWKLPIPPKVGDAMDLVQKWAVGASREALIDYGYPDRPLNPNRTAVIFGNAMAGDQHYRTSLRAFFPEFARELRASPAFRALSDHDREAILREAHEGLRKRLPLITEDTMPGELANIIAGRVAAVFDFHGPNFTVDAACASAMAAMTAAIEGLEQGDYDVVVTGGIDSNMSASSYIKFCKIGALSATGTRPYDADADGFVMGEGGAVFVLKRLEDAEAAGDKIYAVIRGIGGASDGKGKGITAPNPVGQRLAVERGWIHAGLSPATCSLAEGHGTSTRVGDVVEVTSIAEVFKAAGVTSRKIPLGSVKSNIGHLKGAAGAAGVLKATFALHDKVLPPSLGLKTPNPKIDFDALPFTVNTELRPWDEMVDGVRRACVSAFGFGGTNFHIVMEEYIPGRIARETKPRPVTVPATLQDSPRASISASARAPLRGIAMASGSTAADVMGQLSALLASAEKGDVPAPQAPDAEHLTRPLRVAIDFGNAAELTKKIQGAQKALTAENPAIWKMLRAQGVFKGAGPRPKVAFLYPGQGSQYVNMLAELRESEPVVRETFDEADRVMKPIIGRNLTEIIFADPKDVRALEAAEEALRQTAFTQPAVLTVDIALTRLMAEYGIKPDMVMGHSLGEYGALVAAGVLPFGDALEAVCARGSEMTRVSVADNGLMAAVLAPLADVERILAKIKDYVVIANINSTSQAVIGGSTRGVTAAVEALQGAGFRAIPLNVSHAFHTTIVEPASGPLQDVLRRLRIKPPEVPVVANVDGQLYPSGEGVEPAIVDILGKQIAAPVQFIKGLNTLYGHGIRLFIELGPKKALHGFVEDVFASKDDVVALFTNHPKVGEVPAFNQALAGAYAAGFGATKQATQSVAPSSIRSAETAPVSKTEWNVARRETNDDKGRAAPVAWERKTMPSKPFFGASAPSSSQGGDRYQQLGMLFAEFLERGMAAYAGVSSVAAAAPSVVVSGVGIGLPGGAKVFSDDNTVRVLRGDQFIDVIPVGIRNTMVDRKITRLVKTDAGGGPRFEIIESPSGVIKLAGRAGQIGLDDDFGYPKDRMGALDSVTELAIAAGIEALKDAGIPLVQHYKTTTKGTKLPDRWGLPEALRDDTGIIFAAAFPGYDNFAKDMRAFHEDHERRQRIADLESLRSRLTNTQGTEVLRQEIDRRLRDLHTELEQHPYSFDRRFIFRVLAMGHSQFAEYIGARGPNTHVNSACASGTQAFSLAEDWIRAGRCRRVVIVSADNVTSDDLMGWIGSGFLASGAAATDEVVAEVAVPFDRRRHGLVLGMGAAAMVVERADAAEERGVRPICEIMGTATANSAFHGSRLNVEHICDVLEKMLQQVEARYGLDRRQLAENLVFVSHETYTPARGGSAQAEVTALRRVFGHAADRIVIANTKGMTGHAMGTGIEDAVAIRILETGIVPPVPNFKEIDPELGQLNLSQGGAYPVYYALRLGAGFGSQISMSLMRWVPSTTGERPAPNAVGYQDRIFDQSMFQNWLADTTGYNKPELEIVSRTLRFKDQGPTEPRLRSAPSSAVAPSASLPAFAPGARVPAGPAASRPTVPFVPDARPASVPVSASVPAIRPATAHATAAPQTQAQVQASAPSAPMVDAVEKQVLAIVSEKTGYPPDMLDLELDLEADLGIDTVKQAETFAAVREAYNIPREESIQLRDFPTMKHVIKFVKDRRPDLAQASPAASSVATSAAPIGHAGAPMAASSVTPSGADEVMQRVLQIVSEKTGYPPDMLDLELDLEADLGIDTVKQAETFAAVRESYDIPRLENLQLRDFPTMKHVIQFVLDRRPDLAAKAAIVAASAPTAAAAATGSGAAGWTTAAPTSAPSHDEVTAKVLQIVSEKTGYPPDMLDLDLDLEADLGVDTVKQAETFAAVRETYAIPREENLQLRDFPTMSHVIQFVRDRRPDLAPKAAAVPAPSAHAGSSSGAASTPASSTPAHDEITQKVLEIVSEKTGYPPDMLDLELDLEADLGIDTVKQAETFAAVRAAYDIPREENIQLRDFPTMKHVIQFVRDRKPGQSGNAAATAAPTASPVRSFENTTSAVRRVPVAVLRPPLDVCKGTGVELGRGSRVLIVPDQGGVAKSLAQRLDKMGVDVLFLEDMPADDVLVERLEALSREKPIQGVYWLPALDHEGEIASMDAAGWKEAVRVRVKLLYRTMKALYEQVAARGTFLVTGTRLGGRHGYDEAGAMAPMGGAVAGFTKTYKRERPDALVKVVDFEPSRKTAALADQLIAETLQDPGVVEIGYVGDDRWTVSFDEHAMGAVEETAKFGPDSVFVVTGAAGSIVSAIIDDLATGLGGVFHLLDLTPKPSASDPDLMQFRADKEALKRTLFERLKAQGERATPAAVEKLVARLERANAALVAIEAVERAGGTAHYHEVNLLDGEAVTRVVNEIRSMHGRVDVLLHAAGLEISHFLPDKKPEEYNLVFDVKSDGWFHLLKAMGDMPLGATVVFSSIAGRFGNGGQADYSAANDLLCKYTSSFKTTRPGTRGIAIDWTAWAAIGMASRGSIPKMMEMARIDMLAPEVGIPEVRRELVSGFGGEVIVGGRLGILLEDWDATGGLDPAALTQATAGPMGSRIIGMGIHDGLRIETDLDPKTQPFLYDHQIDGTPVLPGVMGVEGFGEISAAVFRDWHVTNVEDVNFLAPFKFYRTEPRTLTLSARFSRDGDALVATCRLVGARMLKGQDQPQLTTHFTGRVRLTREAPVLAAAEPPPPASGPSVDRDAIYQVYFHGPAYQVLEKAWRHNGFVVGQMPESLPGNHVPDDASMILEPRLVELCFQTAGVWQLGQTGKMGLPMRIDRVTTSPAAKKKIKGRLHAIVTPRAGGESFDAVVVDEAGTVFATMNGYRTAELPGDVDSAKRQPLANAMVES